MNNSYVFQPPGLECRIITIANYFRKVKNSGWATFSSTIDQKEKFKTSRAGFKVLTASSTIFLNSSWLSSSTIVFLFVSV